LNLLHEEARALPPPSALLPIFISSSFPVPPVFPLRRPGSLLTFSGTTLPTPELRVDLPPCVPRNCDLCYFATISQARSLFFILRPGAPLVSGVFFTKTLFRSFFFQFLVPGGLSMPLLGEGDFSPQIFPFGSLDHYFFSSSVTPFFFFVLYD